jgi:hypothetical protein
LKNILIDRSNGDKGRPDYYITPSRDFTIYTRDCAEKYWSKETAFDWSQDVEDNLAKHLDSQSLPAFSQICFMTLPMIAEAIGRKLAQLRDRQLPMDEDALKDIGECILFDGTSINKALQVQLPLKKLRLEVSKLKDQLEIFQRELSENRELKKLGMVKNGITVRHLKTAAEQEEQNLQLSQIASQIRQVENECAEHKTRLEMAEKELKANSREQFQCIQRQVLLDLQETQALVQKTLQSGILPTDGKDIGQLKHLVLKRQLRGLRDIANHALVVEQSAIAPLTMGIIHYKRHREIQEAMTTFINDEAKHSATFRRFLAEKLVAREFVSARLITGANRYMWIARFMPGAGMFLAGNSGSYRCGSARVFCERRIYGRLLVPEYLQHNLRPGRDKAFEFVCGYLQ